MCYDKVQLKVCAVDSTIRIQNHCSSVYLDSTVTPASSRTSLACSLASSLTFGSEYRFCKPSRCKGMLDNLLFKVAL